MSEASAHELTGLAPASAQGTEAHTEVHFDPAAVQPGVLDNVAPTLEAASHAGAVDLEPEHGVGAPPAESASASAGPSVVPAASPRDAVEAELTRDPRVGATWHALLDLVKQSGDLDAIRSVYERFFDYFPNSAADWIAYAELELAHSNFAQVDAIFLRCLRTTLSVDLWRFYLAYTRRVNPLPPATAEESGAREQTQRVLEDAYEFALRYVGWDRESGPIWQDYLQLIRAREAHGSWQEGQKMDQLRRVYQRAVVIPLNAVETIWREYDQYENALSKLTAKKFLAERSPAYMQARGVLRELRALTDNLVRPRLPLEPAWIAPSAEARPLPNERQSLQAWRRYLEWEERNPLQMEEPAALQARVLSAYRKAVMYVRFDSVVWYNAATFCRAAGRPADALAWLSLGLEACPWSMLLAFAYADACREQQRYADGVAALDALVAYAQGQVESRTVALAEAQRRIDAEPATVAVAEDDDEDSVADAARRSADERAARKAQLADAVRPELDEWRDGVAQIWIKYMQFVRRAEGIRPTRQVFGRARKSPYCTWPVYEANALLEYHCAQERTVATKVFELALKTFGLDEALVVRYLEFLIGANDDTNARALFERAMSSLPPERARVVWMRWAEYEYSFGDASAMARLEARLPEVFPDAARTDIAADRLRYRTLDLVRAKDLGYSRGAAHVMKREKGRREEASERREDTDATEAEAPVADEPAPPAAAPKGRLTMEEIRRSLADDASRKDAEKRAAASSAKDAPSKKAKHDAPRRARETTPRTRDTPPPPSTPPSVPDAVYYFLRCVRAHTTDPACSRLPQSLTVRSLRPIGS